MEVDGEVWGVGNGRMGMKKDGCEREVVRIFFSRGQSDFFFSDEGRGP